MQNIGRRGTAMIDGSKAAMANLRRLAVEPFHGTVSLDQVAARIEAMDLGDRPPIMRECFARLLLGDCADAPAPVGTMLKLGGIKGLLLTPSLDGAERGEDCGQPGVVWFHGGGYVFGSPQTHWRLGAAIAAMTGEYVFLPCYRLAPEHPWPAQLDDALAVVRAVQGAGGRVALGGDSAGGHLALTAALALAREGRPVAALGLCSPNTDRSGLNTTRTAQSAGDPMNDDEQDRALARLAFGVTVPDHPQLSPLLDDLSVLPPTHLEVGECEVLRDDSRLLASWGTEAGADISVHVEPGHYHMWQLWTPWLESANASVARMAAFVCAKLR